MKRDVSLLILVAAFVVVTAIAVHYLTREQIGLSPADDSGGGDAPPSGEPSFQRLTFIPQCDDGIDNDNDGEIDYPDDNGCDSPEDNSERVTKFGIFYFTTHCFAAEGNPWNFPIFDMTNILSGNGEWGNVGDPHWWGKPALGYYCLSNNDDALREHAIILRDAGIDFVFIDATNFPYAEQVSGYPNATLHIIEPVNRMLEVWNTIPDSPKIVFYGVLTNDSTLIPYLLQRLELYPNLNFYYLGKPLVLLGDNRATPLDQVRASALAQDYTIRIMDVYLWGGQWSPNMQWSFREPCTSGFLESQGYATCGQRLSIVNGIIEQIPITTAYQDITATLPIISDPTTAVPKFSGRTFLRQFETLNNYPDTPIATLNSWNEWQAVRMCLNAQGRINQGELGCFTYELPNGNKIFVDEYAGEYNKDIEPAENEIGDFYYQLMKRCIELYAQGESCDPICGNGIVESPEECDDGNRNEDDQCSNECTWTYCGDLIVQQPNGNPPPGVGFVEECDGTGTFCGNLFPGWNCLGIAECNPQNTVNQCEYDISNCNCSPPPPPQPPVCGNNVCEPGETCENCEQDCGVICGWVFRCDDRTGLQRFCRFFRQ